VENRDDNDISTKNPHQGLSLHQRTSIVVEAMLRLVYGRKTSESIIPLLGTSSNHPDSHDVNPNINSSSRMNSFSKSHETLEYEEGSSSVRV
jgi:hypothetical protein